jgi:hypothetical protein
MTGEKGMRKTILVALLLACGIAQASEWIALGKGDDGTVVYLDSSSIRVNGGIRRVWTKSVYVPHTTRTTGLAANKWIAFVLTRNAFNCKDENYRLEAQTQHFDDGTDDSVPASKYPTPWEPVVPETVSSVSMAFVCTWKPK